MKKLAVLLFFIISTLSFGQAPKKLLKLLNGEYIELKGELRYKNITEGDYTFHTSTTIKNDTTGVSNNVEFLMFRDDITDENGELFKLVRTDFVTNDEYQKFIDWVIDSTMRELIYLNIDPTGSNAIPENELAELLKYEDYYFDEVDQKWKDFNPSQPYINRQTFPLNWDFNWSKKISYYQYYPLIHDLYLRPHERFYGKKSVDERRIVYSFDPKSSPIRITPDKDSWAINSDHIFDIYYTLSKYYSEPGYYPEMPVVGLLGTQIKAYLLYMERILQQKIDKKKLQYRVRITLPTGSELKAAHPNYADKKQSLTVEGYDLTDNWRVSNAEYYDFIKWVEDSIYTELIYRYGNDVDLTDEDLSEMLKHDDIYYDEAGLSWSEFDPSNLFTNRYLFYFDSKFDWKKKLNPEQTKNALAIANMADGFDKKKLVYKYYWQDLKERAKTGELIWNDKNEIFDVKVNDQGLKLRALTFYGIHGVRRNADLSEFNIMENINIYPGINCIECNQICYRKHGKLTFGQTFNDICDKCPQDFEKEIPEYDFETNPEAPVENISYKQALAFYNWKFHRNTPWSNSSSKIIDDLVPTEEEFLKVQKGETVKFETQSIEYPSPLFRYVIHIFPK